MIRTASDRDRTGVAGVDRKPPILAIDYGRKRIGLALSDSLGLTAKPLAILSRTSRRNDLRYLRQMCREHGVKHILVGHPLNMTGTPGEMADEAARFAARVGKELGISTELLDERLTSWEAEQTVTRTNSKRRKGAPVDDLAAAILLHSYLEKHPDLGRSASGSTPFRTGEPGAPGGA